MAEQVVSTRHRFRRLARRQERFLTAAYPELSFKVVELTEGQRTLWGRRWAVVQTK